MTRFGSLQLSRAAAEAADRSDPLASLRDRFRLPPDVLYFDGNSLGPVPVGLGEHLDEVVDKQWGRDLIGSWNQHDWIGLPSRVGARIAPLIGAAAHEVLAVDSTSVNLFKLLAAALELRPARRVILCQSDHFPTDLYIAQGLADWLGEPFEVRRSSLDELPAALAELDGEVAVVCASHVDYRSGRLFDMAALNDEIHAAGALALWDLSHSAGALGVDLATCETDLAVGCGYKFLNGGPGAPAFLFVAEQHQAAATTPLQGWLGHADPFDFDGDYRPAAGIDRFRCGTPPILSLAALDRALDAFHEVDMAAVRAKSLALGELFLDLAQEACTGYDLQVACPRDPARRGSQVCLRHPDGYAIMQALISRGVIGDFRAPDILRFGITPLYQRHVDVWDAVEQLRQVMMTGEWRQPRFQIRNSVT